MGPITSDGGGGGGGSETCLQSKVIGQRGEKAFCSWDCRLEEISIDGEQEKFIMEANGESPKPENGDDVFDKSIFVAI